MAFFIAVPPKKTTEIDIVGPLKNTLCAIYPNHATLGLTESLEALNKLRKDCTGKSLDFKHEVATNFLQKYYDGLCCLEAKCPPSDVQIPFKWKDSLGGSSFLGSSSLTIPSLAYEKACVLYNIAAAQTQTAAATVNETLNNDLALKQAAKFFCSASGIFQALKHIVPSAIGNQDVTVDLHNETLQALHMVMLSQAQEAFFYKAANDNMKDAVIAKIASQCEDYYNETYKYMQVKFSWPERDWLPLVQMKSQAFKGIAEYYQGIVCGVNQNFGEQLCRLTKSLELLKGAESRGGVLYPSAFKEYLKRATRAFEEARKDNEFIYHARIPDYNSLAPIGKAVLAKATPIPDRFLPDQPDLFSKLLPVALQQAAAKLDASKQDLVNKEIATLRELSQVLDATLASMNLPAALEDTGDLQLPNSLKQKSDAIRSQGGMQELERKLVELPELLKRNKEILDETERMLNQEEDTDNKLREQFKERWNRTPSAKLVGGFKDNITKYRKIIQNAVDADEKVRQKFLAHRENIRILESSEQEIIKSLPSGATGAAGSPAAKKLTQLMSKVEALKNERAVIEAELQGSPFDDLKSKFLNALSGDRAINESALATESLYEIYAPLQKQVRDSRERQEALLNEIREANEEFVKSKGPAASSSREAVLSNLASAHGAFNELTANVSILASTYDYLTLIAFFSLQLNEGTKFYNDLTQLLLNLQSKVNDFCFARKAEREELCADLQKSIVNSATQAPPAAPSYHSAPPASSTAPQAPPAASSQPGPAAPPTHPGYPPNPYGQYYYPPPPLPMGYNPYAQPCKYIHLSLH